MKWNLKFWGCFGFPPLLARCATIPFFFLDFYFPECSSVSAQLLLLWRCSFHGMSFTLHSYHPALHKPLHVVFPHQTRRVSPLFHHEASTASLWITNPWPPAHAWPGRPLNHQPERRDTGVWREWGGVGWGGALLPAEGPSRSGLRHVPREGSTPAAAPPLRGFPIHITRWRLDLTSNEDYPSPAHPPPHPTSFKSRRTTAGPRARLTAVCYPALTQDDDAPERIRETWGGEEILYVLFIISHAQLRDFKKTQNNLQTSRHSTFKMGWEDSSDGAGGSSGWRMLCGNTNL